MLSTGNIIVRKAISTTHTVQAFSTVADYNLYVGEGDLVIIHGDILDAGNTEFILKNNCHYIVSPNFELKSSNSIAAITDKGEIITVHWNGGLNIDNTSGADKKISLHQQTEFNTEIPIGTIIEYHGSEVPSGWLGFDVNESQEVDISDYPLLYRIIGNNYYSPPFLDSNEVTVTEKAGGNTGDGQIVMDSINAPVSSNALLGIYKVRCVSIIENSGIFEITDPNNNITGTAIVGQPYWGDLRIIILDGDVDYIVNDGWDIEVTPGDIIEPTIPVGKFKLPILGITSTRVTSLNPFTEEIVSRRIIKI